MGIGYGRHIKEERLKGTIRSDSHGEKSKNEIEKLSFNLKTKKEKLFLMFS